MPDLPLVQLSHPYGRARAPWHRRQPLPHAFGAAPGSSARLLIALMPGVERHGYFRFLEQLALGQTTPADFEAAQQDYDNYFTDAPQWWAERNANRA